MRRPKRGAICSIVAGLACAAPERERIVSHDSAGAPPSASALVSAAGPRRVALRVPADSEIADTVIRRSMARGRALMRDTRDSLPAHVGNRLRCVSCHFEDGTQADAMPWIGVYARFPQYRSRSGTVNLLEDRINDCFERSMNGRALERDGRDMRDIIAFMAFLSMGVPVGAEVVGQGIPRLAPLAGDTVRGAGIYAARCASCHGARGEGTTVATPLWGSESWNIGAGMARVRTAAAFIRQLMPRDRPGSLSDQEAFDVAAYINSRPRPDFAGKERDWPNGDPPPDVAYPTRGVSRKPGAGR